MMIFVITLRLIVFLDQWFPTGGGKWSAEGKKWNEIKIQRLRVCPINTTLKVKAKIKLMLQETTERSN